MKRHIQIIFFVSFLLVFCSCATILNTAKTPVTVITSEPASLIIGNDTIGNPGPGNTFFFDRDKKPLNITAYNESVTKSVSVQAANSAAYWLNLYPNLHFWTGFFIDTRNKKRYTYPRTIYIDLATSDSSYLKYRPLEKAFDNPNILKTTPLKLAGIVNPAFEVSYERRTGRSFSTQIAASWLLPMSIMDIGNDFKPNIKGFRLSLEEKWYFRRSAPLGPYAGLEVNYLNTQYRDYWYFGEKEVFLIPDYEYTNYPDTFGIKKQTASFNLKLGYQHIIKRYSFDFYAGIGIRYKDVRHFDRINPLDEMEMPRHLNAYYLANQEGKYWTVSIPVNISVGWTF